MSLVLKKVSLRVSSKLSIGDVAEEGVTTTADNEFLLLQLVVQFAVASFFDETCMVFVIRSCLLVASSGFVASADSAVWVLLCKQVTDEAEPCPCLLYTSPSPRD